MAVLQFALAQHDFSVGAVTENAARAVELIRAARADGAALVVFPELALCGYPPDDLLRRASFVAASDEALARVAAAANDIAVLMGHAACAHAVAHTLDEHAFQQPLLNALSLLRDGAVETRYAKHALPNYGVFDEKRYFTPGTDPKVIDVGGVRVGLLICEDVWIDAPVDAACAAGAEVLIVPNASPYDVNKADERLRVLQRQAQRCGVAIAYLNGVGGQDDVIFDGASLLVNADGSLEAQAPSFRELLLHARFDSASRRFRATDWPPADGDADAVLYAGLVCGVRDYVTKNGFPGVLLGLSGGIDSALTLALAVDALGPNRVTAIMLPSRYTSRLSLDGAREQAAALGVACETMAIEPAFEAMTGVLTPAFKGKPADSTEENLQARIRGALLMALSNKHGRLLLTTGNKSELAVGYATLYGDMCGAYAPLKDVYKTVVYRLAKWRNGVSGPRTRDAGPESAVNNSASGGVGDGDASTGADAGRATTGPGSRVPGPESAVNNSASGCVGDGDASTGADAGRATTGPGSRVPGPAIPWAVIERAPSAELRADQTDQDSLPDYDILDAILQRFIEGEQSPANIIAAGFDADTVRRVCTLVLRNEFKRRQSAPGPKVTSRAFGRERRYPITSGWT